MNIDKELRRGEQARQLLSNELYVETMGMVRQGIIDKWISCPLRDIEGQHELKLMLKLLDNLTGHIKTTLDTGKMAEIQLQSDNRVTRIKRAIGL